MNTQAASLTIGVVARRVGVAIDTIRYYEREGQKRLAAIEQRIAELQRVRDGLAELVASCPGHGKPEQCPILRALSGDEVES